MRHLLQVLQHLQVQYWAQDEGSNIECRSAAHNLRPICLLKNRSLAQKLAFFSSWRRISCLFVHSLTVYCAKAVLVGSTIDFFNHVEADEKSTNFYLQGLVGGAIILAQYLRIAPIVIPTLLAQFTAVLVGSIVIDFFNQVEGDKCSSFFVYKHLFISNAVAQ